jgi:murein DD-endopeptidase MepM/ murein hydrolase activator NlpD
MSSFEFRASSHSPARLSVLAASLLCATALAGCSADLARLDMANLGYSDSADRRAPPVPSEAMHRGPAAQPDEPPAPYSYQPSPRQPSRIEPVRQAGLPEPSMPLPPRESTAAARPMPAPSRPHVAAAPAGGQVVVVASGDTVYGIARRHGVSIDSLMGANGLKNPTIFPGQKLTIPSAGQRQSPPRRHQVAAAPPVAEPVRRPPVAPASAPPHWTGTYTVTPRDSLYVIAKRHHVTVAELQSANAITHPSRLRSGMVLKVPGGATPEAAPTELPATVAQGGPAPVPPAVAREAQAQLAPGPAARPRIINAGPEPVTEPPPERIAVAAPTSPVLNDASPTEPPAASPKSGTQIGKFRWPAKGRIIAGFGKRPDQSHNDGINILVPQGSTVHAAESGTVAYAGSELKGYGNLVLIRHEDNWVSAYAHNDTLLVRRGDHVERGQEIAKAGKTGAVDQPQLHFELRQGSKPVDPVPYLER